MHVQLQQKARNMLGWRVANRTNAILPNIKAVVITRCKSDQQRLPTHSPGLVPPPRRSVVACSVPATCTSSTCIGLGYQDSDEGAACLVQTVQKSQAMRWQHLVAPLSTPTQDAQPPMHAPRQASLTLVVRPKKRSGSAASMSMGPSADKRCTSRAALMSSSAQGQGLMPGHDGSNSFVAQNIAYVQTSSIGHAGSQRQCHWLANRTSQTHRWLLLARPRPGWRSH